MTRKLTPESDRDNINLVLDTLIGIAGPTTAEHVSVITGFAVMDVAYELKSLCESGLAEHLTETNEYLYVAPEPEPSDPEDDASPDPSQQEHDEPSVSSTFDPDATLLPTRHVLAMLTNILDPVPLYNAIIESATLYVDPAATEPPTPRHFLITIEGTIPAPPQSKVFNRDQYVPRSERLAPWQRRDDDSIK